MSKLKIRKLPKGTRLRNDFSQFYGANFNKAVYNEMDCDAQAAYVFDDADGLEYNIGTLVKAKLRMLNYVQDALKEDGSMEFDPFNGTAPTRINLYKAYEFPALWIWSEIVYFIKHSDEGIKDSWYNKYKSVLASVMRKYPKITGILITIADLKIPGNKLLDYSKMENADFDGDHTDEGLSDENADKFKSWILKWCNLSTERDKMRVRNWFQTKKSHKQIFAEIHKVVGNPSKFNARLALFVEHLFNQQGLDYFFEKAGFATKEDLFMAYFEKLTQFDEETKKSFIKKYLLG